MDELLLDRVPGGHDHVAGARVAIGAVVLGSLQAWKKENMGKFIKSQKVLKLTNRLIGPQVLGNDFAIVKAFQHKSLSFFV